MILLMHLSGCSEADEENHSSRHLLDQTFTLRIDRITNGAVLPLNDRIRGPHKPNSNPRYHVLQGLRKKVWHTFGWQIPNNEGLCNHSQADKAEEGMCNGASHCAASGAPSRYGDQFEDSAMLDELDSMLADDFTDLIQWDG